MSFFVFFLFLPMLQQLFFDRIAIIFSLEIQITECVVLLIWSQYTPFESDAIQKCERKYFRFYRIHIVQILVEYVALLYLYPIYYVYQIGKPSDKNYDFYISFLKFWKKAFLLLWDPHCSNFNENIIYIHMFIAN